MGEVVGMRLLCCCGRERNVPQDRIHLFGDPPRGTLRMHSSTCPTCRPYRLEHHLRFWVIQGGGLVSMDGQDQDASPCGQKERARRQAGGPS